MEKELNERLQVIEANSALAARNSALAVRNSLLAKSVLTLDDAALLTGLSKSHLYKLTCKGNIPHYKPNGKQIYFDRAELEAWMKRNRYQSRAEAESAAIAHVVAANQKGGAL